MKPDYVCRLRRLDGQSSAARASLLPGLWSFYSLSLTLFPLLFSGLVATGRANHRIDIPFELTSTTVLSWHEERAFTFGREWYHTRQGRWKYTGHKLEMHGVRSEEIRSPEVLARLITKDKNVMFLCVFLCVFLCSYDCIKANVYIKTFNLNFTSKPSPFQWRRWRHRAFGSCWPRQSIQGGKYGRPHSRSNLC